MNSRELRFIKMALLILVSICTASILYNIIKREESNSTSYQPYKRFSIVVSEEKWDESTMPKGRRSPKGVLYNPEK